MGRRAVRWSWCWPVVWGAAWGCGPSPSALRHAAAVGDLEGAVLEAGWDAENLRAVAEGVLERLRADRATVRSARSALEAAPVTALELLERWAEESAGDDASLARWARARVSELRGGAYGAELEADFAVSEGAERASVLRGLVAGGWPVERLVEVLGEPALTGVAAAALQRSGGVPAEWEGVVRDLCVAASEPERRAVLLGLLDPDDPASQVVLRAGLRDGSPGVRRVAAGRLAAGESAPTDPELAGLIGGPASAEGLAAAEGFARRGVVEPLERLRSSWLGSAEVPAELQAGLLLVLPADAALAEGLDRLLPEAEVPVLLAGCRRRLAGAPADPVCAMRLAALAGSGEGWESTAAAELAFEEGLPGSAERLRGVVAAGDPTVRRRVMRGAAARRFDGRLLAAGLTDADPDVAAAAAVAVLRVPLPYGRSARR